MENRVRFADNIIPICLPGNDDLLIGEVILKIFIKPTWWRKFSKLYIV